MSVAQVLHLPQSRSARSTASAPARTWRRKSDRVPWPGTAILALATVWVLAGNSFHTETPAGFTLQASDHNGRVEIQWDPNIESIRQSDSATLDAVDGGSEHRYPVESRILHGGAMAYVRQGKDVALTVTLYKNSQPSERSAVLSIAPVGPTK
jgi:hypothetical protein